MFKKPRTLKLSPLARRHLTAVQRFSDEQFGVGFYDPQRLQKTWQLCFPNAAALKHPASFVLTNSDDSEDPTIYGLRLSLPPGAWLQTEHFQKLTHPTKWRIASDRVAYFQTLALHPDWQQQGWGRRLSELSITALEKQGAEAIVCHSWLESPGDSSQRYLQKMGFDRLVEIANFWQAIDYHCVVCGHPCRCTAVEMIKYLKGHPS